MKKKKHEVVALDTELSTIAALMGKAIGMTPKEFMEFVIMEQIISIAHDLKEMPLCGEHSQGINALSKNEKKVFFGIMEGIWEEMEEEKKELLNKCHSNHN